MSVRRPGLRVVWSLVALVALLALSACTRQDPSIAVEEQIPADQREEVADDGDGEGDDGEDADAETGEGVVSVTAVDNEFTEFSESAPAGTVTFELDNQGNLEHDIVIEEAGDTVVVEAQGGETQSGTIDLEAGEYTFYCDIPGHRSTMEESINIE